MNRILLCAARLTGVLVFAAAALSAPADTKSTLVHDHALPNVPGKSIRAVLVEYPPGGASPAHRPAFIYATVLAGAVRSRVNDGPPNIYHAGKNFSEFPGDRHMVSENASTSEPARLLAVFVIDTQDTMLVTPLAK